MKVPTTEQGAVAEPKAETTLKELLMPPKLGNYEGVRLYISPSSRGTRRKGGDAQGRKTNAFYRSSQRKRRTVAEKRETETVLRSMRFCPRRVHHETLERHEGRLLSLDTITPVTGSLLWHPEQSAFPQPRALARIHLPAAHGLDPSFDAADVLRQLLRDTWIGGDHSDFNAGLGCSAHGSS